MLLQDIKWSGCTNVESREFPSKYYHHMLPDGRQHFGISQYADGKFYFIQLWPVHRAWDKLDYLTLQAVLFEVFDP